MGRRSLHALYLCCLTGCPGSSVEYITASVTDDVDDSSESGDSTTTTSGPPGTSGNVTTGAPTSGDPDASTSSAEGTESGPPPACDGSEATCETANVVARCSGGTPVAEPCPNGTNCENGTCNPVSCAGSLPSNNNGGVTVYWFAQGTLTNPNDPTQNVHCSYGATRNFNFDDGGAEDRVFNIIDERLFGAIATADYGGSAACGSCVELQRGGNTVRITIADECPVGSNPTCTSGHIDLSRQAFQTLTGQGTGDINGVSWRVVPCGWNEPIAIKLREPDNIYYKAFIVMKHEYPIVRAQYQHVEGHWVDAVRDPANFFYSDESNGNLTYRVRIFDVNGGIIEQELQPGIAEPQAGTHQFACQ